MRSESLGAHARRDRSTHQTSAHRCVSPHPNPLLFRGEGAGLALPLAMLRPSRWHPALYPLSVARLRLFRHAERWLSSHDFARTRAAPLSFRVFKHTSKLIRAAPGVDLALQHGKVQNLKAAIPLLTDVVIRPGQTFSFYELVGPRIVDPPPLTATP